MGEIRPGLARKPLAARLGLMPGMRVAFFHAPATYPALLGKLPEDLNVIGTGGGLDVVHYFTRHRQALASALPGLKSRIKPAGAIWISWPKQAARVKTDLDENVVRHLALQQGLVDVKVVAIDATWSGLKLVIPLRLRPQEEQA